MVGQTASRMSKIVLQSSRSSERLIDVEYLLLSVYEVFKIKLANAIC